MATDNMSKYDSAVIGATTAGLTTFAIVANRMRMEQELFNKTDGKRGVNWSADAKAVDTKLKAMPKKALNSFKQSLSDSVASATGKVKDVLGMQTPETEDPASRYKGKAEQAHAARIEKLQKGTEAQVAKERITEGTKARRAKLEASKPLVKPDFKIPKGKLALGAGAGALGMYMNQKGKDLQASDSRGFERIFDDIEGKTLETISPLSGLGAGIAAGLATNEAITRKLRGMYDPTGDLGMTRTQSYGRLYDDAIEQTEDYLKNKKNKLKLKRAKTSAERADILADQEDIRERAKERYTNRALDEAEVERAKTAERDKLTRQIETQKRDFTRDTTTHNTIRDNINTRIDDLRSSLTSVPKGTSTTQASNLDAKIKDLESLKLNLDSIPEHELKTGGPSAAKYKDFDPGYVQRGTEEVKQQSKKAKRKAAKAATAAVDTAQIVTDEAKTKFQKATQATADVIDKAKKKVGLSTAATVDGVKSAGKGMSYYNKHPLEAVGKAAYKAPIAAAKIGGKAIAAVAPGSTLNLALKTKRDLEQQGVSPIVQQLIQSGASEDEINEAIREDMYATAFANTGIPEMAEQVADWAEKDMSAYDRAGDVAETSWDVIKGIGEGIVSGGKGMVDLAGRTYDWATGEGEFGELRDEEGEYRDIAGYDEPAIPPAKAATVAGTAPKSTGVIQPGVEGTVLADKKKQAEANNKRLWAAQKDAVQRKYGGYGSAQDYADQYGVQAIDTSSGRYGNTPIYKGFDEFGNVSYSDVPTNVMDKSKYDEVAGQAANTARQQYVQFEKASKEQAKQRARGPAFSGMTNEQYDALGLTGQAKANLDYNKSLLSRKKETDLHDRDLQRRIGLAKRDPGYMEHTTQQLLKGQPTQAEMADVKYALNKQRIDDSFKWNPFAKAADPYAVHPREDLSGYWGDAVEEEMEPLAKGYARLAPYSPKQ